ncbi:hypothetical protein WK39_27430 [Burkholderia cepacia]|nr:hypothetical protein WK39_27430 [Burkholderia cepacia]KVS56047.1 hypothetical protein WK40_28970 [Burkholderia cepacia]
MFRMLPPYQRLKPSEQSVRNAELWLINEEEFLLGQSTLRVPGRIIKIATHSSTIHSDLQYTHGRFFHACRYDLAVAPVRSSAGTSTHDYFH